MMLENVCAHIHNYFTDPADIVRGEWTVAGGEIDLSGLVLPGQCFRIVGSVFNDGVYRRGSEAILRDETFTGEIWPMKVPRAVLDIAEEIESWNAQYGAAMASPFQSESVIGVYSYTKQGGNTAVNGVMANADAWKDAFKAKLNPWRKIR